MPAPEPRPDPAIGRRRPPPGAGALQTPPRAHRVPPARPGTRRWRSRLESERDREGVALRLRQTFGETDDRSEQLLQGSEREWISPSTPTARTTGIRRLNSIVAPISAVLPTPGSPWTTSVPLCPSRAASRMRSSTPRSRSRPSSSNASTSRSHVTSRGAQHALGSKDYEIPGCDGDRRARPSGPANPPHRRHPMAQATTTNERPRSPATSSAASSTDRTPRQRATSSR